MLYSLADFSAPISGAAQMRAIVADDVAWSVCGLVTCASPANTDEPIEILFVCGATYVSTRNHY